MEKLTDQKEEFIQLFKKLSDRSAEIVMNWMAGYKVGSEQKDPKNERR